MKGFLVSEYSLVSETFLVFEDFLVSVLFFKRIIVVAKHGP